MTTPENETVNATNLQMHLSDEPGDPVLRVLASSADRNDGLEYSVTLAAGGVVVSGQLVGGTAWWRALEADPDYSGVKQAVQAFREDAETVAPEDTSPVDYEHVHLTNAVYLVGNAQLPTAGGMYWRGRIDQITGWSWGAIATTSA